MDTYEYEERAAIIEYDGKYTRQEAEARAQEEYWNDEDESLGKAANPFN